MTADVAGVAAMTPDERQRLLLGVLLAVHDVDQLRFTALLGGLSRTELRVVVRSLAEVVVGGQLVGEDQPGAARDRLAQEALTLAGQ